MQMNQFPTIQILKCVFREGHLTIKFSAQEQPGGNLKKNI